MKVYEKLAREFSRYNNGHTQDIIEDATYNIEQIIEYYMPSGSGFDSGCAFNWDKSKENKLVIDTAFHHMNEHGYYTKWTEHSIMITPDLSFGFNLRVTGRDYRQIKDYIEDTITLQLNAEYKLNY